MSAASSAARSAAAAGAAAGADGADGADGGGGGGAVAAALLPPSLSRAFSRERERERLPFLLGERERLRDPFRSLRSFRSRFGDLGGKRAGSAHRQQALSGGLLCQRQSAPQAAPGGAGSLGLSAVRPALAGPVRLGFRHTQRDRERLRFSFFRLRRPSPSLSSFAFARFCFLRRRSRLPSLSSLGLRLPIAVRERARRWRWRRPTRRGC